MTALLGLLQSPLVWLLIFGWGWMLVESFTHPIRRPCPGGCRFTRHPSGVDGCRCGALRDRDGRILR